MASFVLLVSTRYKLIELDSRILRIRSPAFMVNDKYDRKGGMATEEADISSIVKHGVPPAPASIEASN